MYKRLFLTFSIIGISISLFFSCSKKSPSESEQTLTEKLQEVLAAGIQQHSVIGASAAVFIPGQKMICITCGLSDSATTVTPDMIFCMASVTKTFTAALVLQLRDEGKLSLEDSLNRWLPDYPNIESTITIYQLLNHTSGIYDFTWHSNHFDLFFQQKIWNMIWTCGALYSTAEDMAKWSQNLFRGDVLSPASLDDMLTFHPEYPYALGVCKYPNTLFQGREAIGHDGGGIGYVARMVYFTKSGISVSIMTNDLYHRDYLDDISNRLVQQLFSHIDGG